MKLGVYVYGLAAIAAGIVDLVFGGFDPDHQPIQAFGDHIPGQQIFAYVVAVALVAGGAALLFRRSARVGAIILGTVYLVFAVFWLPRFYTAPPLIGYAPHTYIGVLGGVCSEIIVVCAAVIVYASVSENARWIGSATMAARWVFGLCSVDFGLQHLTGIADVNNTSMVPLGMPFGQAFWVILTGAAFVLAGVAILSGLLDVLSARLLAIMLLIFSVVTLLPGLAASPHDHGSWGGNAYELIAAASACILADWLALRRQPDQNGEKRAAVLA